MIFDQDLDIPIDYDDRIGNDGKDQEIDPTLNTLSTSTPNLKAPPVVTRTSEVLLPWRLPSLALCHPLFEGQIAGFGHGRGEGAVGLKETWAPLS
jgi:hypothetical protein